MKKIISILLLTLSFCFCSQAQAQKERPDFNTILEKRCEYIAHDLNLDESKEKAFRPIYMEYCKKMAELFKPDPSKRKPKDQKTEAEVEQDIKANFARAKRIIEIKECYYTKLRKILTPKQIVRVYEIERQEQQKMNKRHHNSAGKQ